MAIKLLLLNQHYITFLCLGFIKQPSDETGDTIIVNSGQENVRLTCAYQQLTHGQDIRW